VSKKIATVSTDIRKTLSVCRLAIELAREELGNSKKIVPVIIEHIRKAYEKTYAMPHHLCLKSFSRTVKLLLIAIALEINKRGYNVAYLS
jgi:origin recognition complex subunit 1